MGVGEGAAQNFTLIVGRPLKVFHDVAFDRYIRTAGHAGAVAGPRGTLMPLGEELLKDRQDRQIEQLAVRYGAVHLGDIDGGTADNVRAASGDGANRPWAGRDSNPTGASATRIRARKLIVVNGGDVWSALYVLEASLLPELRLGVPAFP